MVEPELRYLKHSASNKIADIGYFPESHTQEGFENLPGPLPAGWENNRYVDPANPDVVNKTLKDQVSSMAPAVLIRYAGQISLIGQFLNESNLLGAAALLQALVAQMLTANDTDALTAAQPIVTYLQGLGLLE